ncbi:MAG TPA: hypothetical protein PK867_19295, partial [Pirellulales bacterium]|nr:hypothetical protein [Pirellulales bacterium]
MHFEVKDKVHNPAFTDEADWLSGNFAEDRYLAVREVVSHRIVTGVGERRVWREHHRAYYKYTAEGRLWIAEHNGLHFLIRRHIVRAAHANRVGGGLVWLIRRAFPNPIIVDYIDSHIPRIIIRASRPVDDIACGARRVNADSHKFLKIINCLSLAT